MQLNDNHMSCLMRSRLFIFHCLQHLTSASSMCNVHCACKAVEILHNAHTHSVYVQHPLLSPLSIIPCPSFGSDGHRPSRRSLSKWDATQPVWCACLGGLELSVRCPMSRKDTQSRPSPGWRMPVFVPKSLISSLCITTISNQAKCTHIINFELCVAS